MNDLRFNFLKSWDQAEEFDGDFKDALLHYLSINLGLPVVNPKTPWEPTDGGVIEMGGKLTGAENLDTEKR